MSLFKLSHFSFLVILLCFQSCISYESLVNYEQEEELPFNLSEPIKNFKELTIQAHDVLDIKVHSQDVATAMPFNLSGSESLMIGDPDLYQLQGYLVNPNGTIDFPVLGTMLVAGMTKEEIKTSLLKKLRLYIKDPVINIRLLNFKVTVSGEVHRPGSFQIYNDRVTLSEIITMAGDLTPYADRSRIIVVRENNGKRKFKKIDMGSSDIFVSKYYYMKQNDLIYIKPLEEKRGAVADNSNKILPFVSAAVSIAALLLSVGRR